MPGRLTGRVAIITGASRGIGAAAARALAGEGAALLLTARTGDALAAVASEIRASGGRAEAFPADVATPGAMERAAARAEAVFGPVNILVANAAVIDPIGPLSAVSPEDWAKAIDVNLIGVFAGMRALLPGMRARGTGTVVTIGSGAASTPLEGWSAYCASKAAVLMLMRCAHLENRGRGIAFFSLSPGTVATDMQRRIRASGLNAVSQIPFEQHAPPEDPARALAWLASGEADDLSGQEIRLGDPTIRARIGLA